MDKQTKRPRSLATRIASVLVLLCIALLPAACSPAATSPTAPPPAGTADATSPSAAPDEQASNDVVIPEYLNVGGSLPIVKDGFEQKLKLAIQMHVNAGKPEDMWAYKFMEDAMNIDIEVESFTDQNRSEYISLLFAGNDLPDIIMGAALTPSELMMYGSREGQIMDMAGYLNETFMPNLTQLYSENPAWKSAIINSDGQIYSFGYINDPRDQGQIPRMFYNYDWLDKLGLSVPATLDEYLAMLRAFKGMGENIIPVGGSYKSNNSTLNVLNAMGYNTNDPKGISIALRNGEVVLPVADRAAYGEYLSVMNTMYTEGLLPADFYTADATTVSAYMAEGRNGVIAQAPFVFTDNFNEWWGATPLTSSQNPEPFWPVSTSAVTAGQYVVSAKCDRPELAAVLADWFFDSSSINYTLFTNGAPSRDTEHLYGTVGWHIGDDAARSVVYSDYEQNKDIYPNKGEYLNQKVMLLNYRMLGYGYWSSTTWSYQLLDGFAWDECIDGYPDMENYQGEVPIRKTIEGTEMHFRSALKDTMVKYTVDGFPGIVYFDPDTSVTVNSLATIIGEYAEQESAKFITGARPLSEVDAYFNELERLGVNDYVKYYADYYAALQGN